MNKKTLLIAAIILLAIVVGTLYLLSRSNSGQDAQEMIGARSSNSEITDTQSKQNPNRQEGSYIDYRDGIIEDTRGTKLLFFHAPWCPQCVALDADINSGTLPDGVTIIKVDYDSNQALRQKYGVTIQTTVVRVDDSGNQVDKFVPYSRPTLEEVTSNLL